MRESFQAYTRMYLIKLVIRSIHLSLSNFFFFFPPNCAGMELRTDNNIYGSRRAGR